MPAESQAETKVGVGINASVPGLGERVTQVTVVTSLQQDGNSVNGKRLDGRVIDQRIRISPQLSHGAGFIFWRNFAVVSGGYIGNSVSCNQRHSPEVV